MFLQDSCGGGGRKDNLPMQISKTNTPFFDIGVNFSWKVLCPSDFLK